MITKYPTRVLVFALPLLMVAFAVVLGMAALLQALGDASLSRALMITGMTLGIALVVDVILLVFCLGLRAVLMDEVRSEKWQQKLKRRHNRKRPGRHRHNKKRREHKGEFME